MNIHECRKEAVKALRQCCTPHGLYASGGAGGYTQVWARDSVITFLGASLIKDDAFRKCFRKSLDTLAKYQSELGQIPNAVDLYDKKRKKQVTFATIDSSLWYIIGEHVYAKNYGDKKFLIKNKRNIDNALLWVKYQDTGEDKLPEQQPTSDWQDAFPHKYGHVLNTQALYHFALNLEGRSKEANEVKDAVHGKIKKEINFFCNEGYYLPWMWKNHNEDMEREGWFDSLGNLLAIIFELADSNKSKKIIDYIEKNKINKPYPVKAIYPAIKKSDKEWKPYFSQCDAREPYNYLNGGVWPFIGGFYVAALVKLGMLKKAEQELQKLAEANYNFEKKKFDFFEWIDGRNGKFREGYYQAWSIGMYVFAYECVRRNKVIV